MLLILSSTSFAFCFFYYQSLNLLLFACQFRWLNSNESASQSEKNKSLHFAHKRRNKKSSKQRYCMWLLPMEKMAKYSVQIRRGLFCSSYWLWLWVSGALTCWQEGVWLTSFMRWNTANSSVWKFCLKGTSTWWCLTECNLVRALKTFKFILKTIMFKNWEHQPVINTHTGKQFIGRFVRDEPNFISCCHWNTVPARRSLCPLSDLPAVFNPSNTFRFNFSEFARASNIRSGNEIGLETGIADGKTCQRKRMKKNNVGNWFVI